MLRNSRGPHAVQPSVSVPFQHHARKITDAVYFWVRRSFICYSDLLGHLAKFKERLPTFPYHPVPDEREMRRVISAVANCAMSTVRPLSYSFLSCISSIVCGTTQNIASCGSPCTSDSMEYELPSSSAFPSRARRLALFALGLLPGCDKLTTLLAIWRLQLNDDIPELRSEFEKLISVQLQFVCRHWISLLREADCTDDEVMEALSRSIQDLHHWVVAMGIMGEIEQMCRRLNDLYMWLVCIEAVTWTRGSRCIFKGSKQIVHLKRKVHGWYIWVMHSKHALAKSSLSIYGNGQPFIPPDNPLWEILSRDTATPCQIISMHVNTLGRLPPQVLTIKTRGRVSCVVYSPDGRHIASACSDGAMHVWDAVMGTCLQELKGYTGYVFAVAYSPDGRRLASASEDCTVRLWDAATGTSLRELIGHIGSVKSVAFSPDGRHLASASCDYTVRLWDAATGEALQELEGHDNNVLSVAFSPDGRRLASASIDRTVRLWDADTGVFLQELEEHKNYVTSVVFSPDGRHIAPPQMIATCIFGMRRKKSLFENLRIKMACNQLHFRRTAVISPPRRLVARKENNMSILFFRASW